MNKQPSDREEFEKMIVHIIGLWFSAFTGKRKFEELEKEKEKFYNFIQSKIKLAREEVLEEADKILSGVIKELKDSQKYCIEQNGMRICKNCGTEFDKIIKQLKNE